MLGRREAKDLLDQRRRSASLSDPCGSECAPSSSRCCFRTIAEARCNLVYRVAGRVLVSCSRRSRLLFWAMEVFNSSGAFNRQFHDSIIPPPRLLAIGGRRRGDRHCGRLATMMHDFAGQPYLDATTVTALLSSEQLGRLTS